MDSRKFTFKKKGEFLQPCEPSSPFHDLSNNITTRRSKIKNNNSPPQFSSTQMIIGKEWSVESFFPLENSLDISVVSDSPIVLSKTVNLFTKKLTEDPLHCTRCQVKYDLSSKTKPNRKIIDTCGHGICFKCFRVHTLLNSCDNCQECGGCSICKQSCKSCNRCNVDDGNILIDDTICDEIVSYFYIHSIRVMDSIRVTLLN